MQEDPLAGPQSATIAGGRIGQFYGTYLQINIHFKSTSHYNIFIFILLSECPNGHKTFIGNVSLLVRHFTMQIY